MWRGRVSNGDIFSANGPIYGVVTYWPADEVGRTVVMVPGRLRGTEFAIANARRAVAILYVTCLEAGPCHVTVGTNSTEDAAYEVEANAFQLIEVPGAAGGDQTIVVSSNAPIVMAVSDGGDTDYMPVPPIAPHVVGIPSTILNAATPNVRGGDIEERCSDGTNATLTLMPWREALYLGGHGGQYTGPACTYTAANPAEFAFGANAEADGDGGDVTPFLPPELMSTQFVAPIAFEFLAFAAEHPGSVTVGGDTYDLQGAEGIYMVRVGAGDPGTMISSTVPVWAVLECSHTQEEQLLYGNIGEHTEGRDRGG